LCSEWRHQRSKGRGAIAEPIGHRIRGKALDEEGTQRLVAALKGLLWFQEEATASLVVHGVDLESLTIFRASRPLDGSLLHAGSQADFQAARSKNAENRPIAEQPINAQEPPDETLGIPRSPETTEKKSTFWQPGGGFYADDNCKMIDFSPASEIGVQPRPSPLCGQNRSPHRGWILWHGKRTQPPNGGGLALCWVVVIKQQEAPREPDHPRVL
jgi:hypothetical protein